MSLKKQLGMNTGLLLFVLVMCGFLLTCFFKLGPAYLDNKYITDALRSLAESHPEDLKELSKSNVRNELNKYYMINNVRGEAANNLEVERFKEKTLISVNYEVRVPLLANIDVVMKFDNVLDSSKPEECCKPEKESKY